MTAEFIDCSDQRWRAFLGRTTHDFYHLPEYLQFAGKHESGRPGAFYAEDQGAAFLAPVLFRDIPEALACPAGWSDITNPYGYANPLFIASAQRECAQTFLDAFRRVARERDVVCAFFRMHPLLSRCGDMSEDTVFVKHGRTVHIDLSLSIEGMWSQMRHDHREDIRKLERTGFQVAIDDWSTFQEFTESYRSTMRRVGADPMYHFGNEYFADLRIALGERLHLCTVRSPEGDFASGGLFTMMDHVAQGHLAGTAERWTRKAPSKLVIYHQLLHARNAGCRVYHLGGGVGGQEDALFHFKSGFSKLRSEFHTWRIIVDRHKYQLLCQRAASLKAQELNASFFPQYRQ